MTDMTGGLEAAWAGWANALVATLFPAGLGSGQHFAFGQTTLVADVANSDPQLAHAEIFRIADAVPAASPNFVPLASLSDAYGFFLGSVASPALDPTRANWNDANARTPTAYNMPAKMGMRAPPGAVPSGSAADPEAPTTYLPAYELDAGFRLKYGEWQAASAARQTTNGGVIRFFLTVGAPPAAAPPSATPPKAVLPPFLHVRTPPATLPLTRLTPGAGSLPHPVAPAITHEVSIEVSFTGLGTFMIGPSRWFSGTAVRLFADRLSAEDHARFFGRSGVLARRIYQVVLGFEPRVTLSFDETDAGQAKALLAQPEGSCVAVGPLTFDATTLAPTPGKEEASVTTEPNAFAGSTLPILLGVVSTELADPLPLTRS